MSFVAVTMAAAIVSCLTRKWMLLPERVQVEGDIQEEDTWDVNKDSFCLVLWGGQTSGIFSNLGIPWLVLTKSWKLKYPSQAENIVEESGQAWSWGWEDVEIVKNWRNQVSCKVGSHCLEPANNIHYCSRAIYVSTYTYIYNYIYFKWSIALFFFVLYSQSCVNHCHTHFWNIFITPKGNPYPLADIPHSFSQSYTATNILFDPTQDISYKQNHTI